VRRPKLTPRKPVMPMAPDNSLVPTRPARGFLRARPRAFRESACSASWTSLSLGPLGAIY